MFKKSIGIILASAMLLAAVLTGCTANDAAQTSAAQSASASTAAAESASPLASVTEPVGSSAFADHKKITWGWPNNDYGPDKKNWPTDIFKDFCKATNTDIEFIGFLDDQALQTAMASGSLPDAMEINKEWISRFLDAGLLKPMDDYLQYAPDLRELSKLRDAAMRKYYSNGDGKLYFWSPQVGRESLNTEMWNGMTIRWDLYKEMGYPEVKNEDDYLALVKQIVDKHPTTADGKKMFGVGTFTEPGIWGWWIRGCMFGFHNISAGYSLNIKTNEIYSNYMNFDSPVWLDIKFYRKAYQMGIFDTDTFMMKASDYDTKVAAGQYVTANCTWYGGTMYANEKAMDPNTLKKMMVLHIEGQYNWSSSYSDLGWSFYYAMTTNCKEPQRVMEIFNYLETPDGVRMAAIGEKGRLWDVIDGKAAFKPETIAMNTKGGDDWTVHGSGLWDGLLGIPGATPAADGTALNLWLDRSIQIANLDPVQKDYVAHYGNAQMPSDVQENLIKEGKQFDKSQQLGDLITLMPNPPADIRRVESNCDDIFLKALPKLVMAKDDADFQAQTDKVMADLKAAGIDNSLKWWLDNGKEVKDWIIANK